MAVDSCLAHYQAPKLPARTEVLQQAKINIVVFSDGQAFHRIHFTHRKSLFFSRLCLQVGQLRILLVVYSCVYFHLKNIYCHEQLTVPVPTWKQHHYGMFHTSMGYISHVPQGNRPQTMSEKGRPLKNKLESGWTNILSDFFSKQRDALYWRKGS